MLVYLILIFVAVPLVELTLLIKIGQWLGAVRTVALVFAAGLGGAILAKSQGLSVLRRLRQDLESGRTPSDALLDGAMILAAGVLLVTPGVLTDILAFFLLIPPVRFLIKKAIIAKIRRTYDQGRTIHLTYWNWPDG